MSEAITVVEDAGLEAERRLAAVPWPAALGWAAPRGLESCWFRVSQEVQVLVEMRDLPMLNSPCT